jgi:hypothetical protein
VASSPELRPAALPGEIERARLDNGLEVCLLRNAQAPIVSTALLYRVGARDEREGETGIAHFLEHMMFKGSERYAAGEVDRRTQDLGGNNNAFTSHDVTAYWFSFAADRWHEALAIESDRLRGLRLETSQVDAERQVILEEIAMYRDDPWDALEMEVLAMLFGEHAYGRQVLANRSRVADRNGWSAARESSPACSGCSRHRLPTSPGMPSCDSWRRCSPTVGRAGCSICWWKRASSAWVSPPVWLTARWLRSWRSARSCCPVSKSARSKRG